MKFIPYGRQNINYSDKLSVYKSLNEDLITSGKSVSLFENKIKNILSCKYSVVCSSGTAALHLALLSIDLKKNDIVIMPSVNFIAAFNVCNILGAKVYLTDVNSFNGQMSPENLLDCIKTNKLKNIKVVITSQLGGQPLNIIELYKIKKRYNFFLIEDACHSFGAKYYFKNELINVGSCKHSDIATFSFHPVKSITTGEGGVVTTNVRSIADKCKLFRSHGIIRKNKHWEYDVIFSGLNYRLSDINCALGISQLQRLKKFIKYREGVAKTYLKFFSKIPNLVTIPNNSDKNLSSWHLFIISINFKKLLCDKNDFIKFFLKKKIITQFHYIPIYNFKVFKKKLKKKLIGAENYYRSSVSLPIYYGLSKKKIRYITKNFEFFFNRYSKNL
jgi:dTDP-4-amino-4,6-dideoxygalactose transaminase